MTALPPWVATVAAAAGAVAADIFGKPVGSAALAAINAGAALIAAVVVREHMVTARTAPARTAPDVPLSYNQAMAGAFPDIASLMYSTAPVSENHGVPVKTAYPQIAPESN